MSPKISKKTPKRRLTPGRILLSLLLCLFLLFPWSACSALPEPLRHLPSVYQLSDTLRDAADGLDRLADTLARYADEFLSWAEGLDASPPPDVPEESTFAVHFIDVGQADCALVECDGKYMLIDGGNKGDSDLVYSYLKHHEVARLEYLVASHAHEDHMGGLAGAVYAAEIGTALCPVTESDSGYFSDVVKALEKQGKSITVPRAGDSFELGSARVTVLGPLMEYEEINDTSLVLKVEYGSTSFLFTGDMEYAPEIDLVESGLDLSATVLKVGHHGSDSSTCYRFLREVMPEYAVISVGAGNKYGHPTETVLSRLEDAGAAIYRTDLHGTIIARSDGETVTFTAEK